MNEPNLQKPNEVPAGPPPQKARNKKLIITIVIIAVLGVFALGVLFAWSFIANNFGVFDYHSPAEQHWESLEEQLTTNNQQSEVDTSVWQTYRNDEFGFEVRYPENFFIFQEDQPRQSLIGAGEYRSLIAASHYTEQKGVEFSVLFAIVQNELDLDSLKERLDGTHSVITSRDIVYNLTYSDFVPTFIGGRNAYMFLSSRVSRDFGDSCEGRELIVSLQEMGSLQVTLSRCSLTQGKTAKFEMEDQDIFDQILSTFRFVEESPIDRSSLDVRGLEEAIGMYANTGVSDEQLEKVERIVTEGLLRIQNTSGFGYKSIEHLDYIRDIGDLNNDGQNEIYFSAGGAGGACLGGWSYKILYSPRENAYFVGENSFVSEGDPPTETGEVFCPSISKNKTWEGCGADYTQSTCFSKNLQEEKNAAFKKYLDNVINQE